ncbi:solute carrier family 25 member 40-like [Asterias rubens]|uniref:solute carrier family 25 member 40-like n=1 Tax=Asterias rubens TaxID=7604 RepID=UPI0014552B33|nr:solute carrier family 25 member 40-like [Asterias rubens]
MCKPKFLQPSEATGVIVGPNGQPLKNLQQIRRYSVDGSPLSPPPLDPNQKIPINRSRSDSQAVPVISPLVAKRARSVSPSVRRNVSPRNASPSPTRSLPVAPQRPVQPEGGDVTAVQRGIASCAGTVFMSIFMTPLDVVKVRLQAQQQPSTIIRTFRPIPERCLPSTLNLVPYRQFTSIQMTHSHSAMLCQSPPSYKLNGTLDAFAKIARNESWCRLWSGFAPALLMRIPSNVIYFSVYEKLKSAMGFQRGKTDKKNNFLITLSASGTAKAISVTSISPLEMIRTKMQSEPLSYAQLSNCLKRAVKTDGLTSLWRGLGPMLSRDVMYAVLYWTHYELLKAEMCKAFHTDDPTVAMTFWTGVMSGVLAAVVSTPFDVVKTHKQISIGKAPTGGDGPRSRASSLSIMKGIFAQSGVKGLFAGTVPRIFKGAPSSAILITTYEVSISLFKKYNLEHGY